MPDGAPRRRTSSGCRIGPAGVDWVNHYEMRPVARRHPAPSGTARERPRAETPHVGARRAAARARLPVAGRAVRHVLSARLAAPRQAGADRHRVDHHLLPCRTRRSWRRSAPATCSGRRSRPAVSQRLLRPDGAALERGRARCSRPRTRSSTSRNECHVHPTRVRSLDRRRRRRHRRRHRPALRARGLCGLRHAAQPRQAAAAGRARSDAEGGAAHAFASDARKEEEVVALVEQIESTIGPIEVMVFNIGANVPESILTRPRASTSRSGRWPASPAF